MHPSNHSHGGMIDSITDTLRGARSLQEVYELTAELLLTLPGVDMVMIYMVDADAYEAVLEYHRNVPPSYVRKASRIPFPRGITWKVIRSNRVLNVHDAQSDPNVGPAGRELGKHSVLGVPVALKDDVGTARGVIWLWSDEKHSFNDDEVKLLKAVALRLASAVYWAKLLEERSERMTKANQTLINYIGFTDRDRETLRAHAGEISGWIGEMVGAVFDELAAKGALPRELGPEAREEEKRAVSEWLAAIARGEDWDRIWEEQWDRALLAVVKGVPLPYTVSVVNLIQREFLERCIGHYEPEEAKRLYGAFKKATDIIVGLSAEGFIDAFAEGVGISSGISRELLERMARLGAKEIGRRVSGS